MPTVPVTPEAVTKKRVKSDLDKPVPIIAPPPDHVPRLPLSEAAYAKLRLQRLVEREERVRGAESLSGWVMEKVVDGTKEHDCAEWEKRLGIGDSLRRDSIEWILGVGRSLSDTRRKLMSRQVLPEYSDMGGKGTKVPNAPSFSSISPAPSLTDTPTSTRSTGSITSTRSYSPTVIASDSCSSSSIADISGNRHTILPSTRDKSRKVPNLFDQLSTSPETRFHAAYMFLRFFYLAGCHTMPASPSSLGKNARKGCELDEDLDGNIPDAEYDADDDSSTCSSLGFSPARVAMETCFRSHLPTLALEFEAGREMMTWDTAVACLALSVKVGILPLVPLMPLPFFPIWFLITLAVSPRFLAPASSCVCRGVPGSSASGGILR